MQMYTTNNAENRKDLSFLTTLPGASERLKIFNADLNEPDSFKPAIKGCIGVFHLAHPMEFQGDEPEETVTNRAVQGVIGILKTCLELKTVKRIVLTSSVSTIIGQNSSNIDEVLDENSWTDVDFLRACDATMNVNISTYPVSKALSEKAALEFADDNGLDLVVVNPSCTSGPFVLPFIPSSVSMSLVPLLGNPYGYLPANMGLVHVDDVARAQIFLFERPHSSGRYICCATEITVHELSELLASKYPELHQQNDSNSWREMVGNKTFNVSSKKLLEAGFEFMYGVTEIYDDAIKCCKQKGLL